MCGRYVVSFSDLDIKKKFNLKKTQKIERNFNISPSSFAPIILNIKNNTLLVNSYWGFERSWIKKKSSKNSIYNARLEGIFKKETFKNIFYSQRCLVPVSGFYEWSGPKNNRNPYYIKDVKKNIIYFAGLWEERRSCIGHSKSNNKKSQAVEYAFLILTVGSTKPLKNIHHRMPVIVDTNFSDIWLSGLGSEFSSEIFKKNINYEIIPVEKNINNEGSLDVKATSKLKHPKQELLL